MSIRAALYLPGLRAGSMSWTIYQDFAAAVRAHGVEMEVWTDRPPQGAEAAVGTRYLPVRRARLIDRILAPFTRSRRLLQTVRTVAPHLRGPGAPDVLYVEIAYPHGVAVDLARRLARSPIPLVIKPTGEDVLSVPTASYGYRRFRLPRLLLGRTLERAAGVRCISPLVVEAVRDLTEAPCPIIPSGVSQNTVEAARRSPGQLRSDRLASRARLEQQLDLPAGVPLLVILGRLHPFKGIDLAIDALADVPQARLLLVGPSLAVKGWGDYGHWLRDHARARGVGDRLLVRGPVPHARINDVLEGADAVLVPSLLESMNKVTIEAVAAGAPVIVTRTTGISCFMQEPGVAQVIEPRSPRAIAAAVGAVLEGRWSPDPGAARRFVERFAPEIVAGETVHLLRQAVKR